MLRQGGSKIDPESELGTVSFWRGKVEKSRVGAAGHYLIPAGALRYY